MTVPYHKKNFIGNTVCVLRIEEGTESKAVVTHWQFWHMQYVADIFCPNWVWEFSIICLYPVGSDFSVGKKLKEVR